MSEERRVLDVSGLPSIHFGPASLLWWGTIGFIVIEAFTLLLMMMAYLYLRLNEYAWPPEPTPLPDLLLPTISTVLLLALIVPMRLAGKAAHEFDRRRTTRWLVITAFLTAPVVVLRWFDLQALNVHWDTHAYGSAAWALVILHGTLLVVDFFETALMALVFQRGHAEIKHYPDVTDAALYQYYLSVAWVPIYLLVYWGPRLFL